jgi:predicted ArsR family transcriptional regulator
MSADGLATELAKVCSLDDRTRRRLYDFVVDQPEPVTRDQISSALGIERPLAAYHLDKLVEHGLLAASFARPEGRGGPGAGRPAKHYARSAAEVQVSLPARDYRLVAELLARAIEADDNGTVRGAVELAADELGRQLAAGQSGDVVDVLRRQGYEPDQHGGTVRLRNCPFHKVAREHVELVCGMNLALMRGVLSALGVDPATARLDPAPGRCCVVFAPSGSAQRRPG